MSTTGLAMADSAIDAVRSTRRWAVGVLVLGTLALAAYLAMVLAVGWVLLSAVDTVTGRETTDIDLARVLTDVTPGVGLGWCVGLGAAALLGRGSALGARVAGLAAGTLGAAAGAAVLAVTGII